MRILVVEDEAETAKLLKKGQGEEPARRGVEEPRERWPRRIR